jgi:hypothetical protein
MCLLGDALYDTMKFLCSIANNPNDYHLIDPLFSEQLYKCYQRMYLGKIMSESEKKGFERMNTKLKEKKNIIFPICCDHFNIEEHISFRSTYEQPKEYYEQSKEKYNNSNISDKMILRHWILCIVKRDEKKIEIYDSLNIPKLGPFWGNIIEDWMFCIHGENFKVITFNQTTIHQEASTNCGYFVILYFHLHLKGYDIEKIEKSDVCNEKYIKNYSTYIEKYNKIK